MKFSLKKLAVLTLSLGLFFTSCETEEINAVEEISTVIDNETQGEIVDITVNGKMIKAFKNGDHYCVDHDIMVIPDNEIGNTNKINTITSRFWTNGVIYYEISSDFLQGSKEVTYLNNAITNIQNQTGSRITYVNRNGDANIKDYLLIKNGENKSLIGNYRKGAQDLFFSRFTPKVSATGTVTEQEQQQHIVTYTGRIMHELLHAAGLHHEQSRRDRDKYIKILYQNVTNGTLNPNYQALLPGEGRDYSDTFDFGSIMLYGSRTIAGDPKSKLVMTKLDNTEFVQQRNAMSNDDVEAIKAMYPLNPPFSDVAANWAYNEINYLKSIGAIAGTDGKFRPEESLTRAEFASMIHKTLILNNPISDPTNNAVNFSDIATHWAKISITEAVKKGYMSGANGLFRPNDLITKTEVILAISNKLNTAMPSEDLSDTPKKIAWLKKYYRDVTSNQTSTVDANGVNPSSIESWAVDGIIKATHNKFVGNFPDIDKYKFFPKATRSLAVFVLYQGLVKRNSNLNIYNKYKVVAPF